MPPEPSPLDVRLATALHEVARGLRAFGLAAVVLALATLAGTAVATIRMSASGDALVTRIERLSSTLDAAAVAVEEGASAADAFGATLETLTPTLDRTVATLRNGALTLRDLSAAAQSISLFGTRPLAAAAASLDGTATDFETLAGSIEASAATLGRSHERLAAVSDALPPVATNLRRVTENLAPDVEELVGDARLFVLFAGIAFATGMGALGAGSLVLGHRLRRALVEETVPGAS